MTLEELEIVVTAKVEDALKELDKLEPEVSKITSKVINKLEKINLNNLVNNVDKGIKETTKKIEQIKNENKSNGIKISVNNNDAKESITEIAKEIESLQKKVREKELKLDITNNSLDRMRFDTQQQIRAENPNFSDSKVINLSDTLLNTNSTYTSLEAQSNKLNNEVIKYNELLQSAIGRLNELGVKTGDLSNKTLSVNSNINTSAMSTSKLSAAFSIVGKVGKNVLDNIKKHSQEVGKGVKSIAKYALSLISVRSIYNLLSSSAKAWLSSNDDAAKQLSADFEYMKYALGSSFAPIIKLITNLFYNLLKMVQQVVYALTQVNIFANASAKAYSKMSSNAKNASKATKGLSGIHSEINNVSSNNGSNSSFSPSMDLSNLDLSSSLLEKIKNGDWYSIGSTIGEKINNALSSINWDSIKTKAENIGKNIAQFLNGGIEKINWLNVGNTLAQGFNTVVNSLHGFVTTFNWNELGLSISDTINGLFRNVDWGKAGATLSAGVTGILGSILIAIEEIDWAQVGQSIADFLCNIDWGTVLGQILGIISGLAGGLLGALTQLLSTVMEKIIYGIVDFFSKEIEECGGNIILGLLKGIWDVMVGITEWIEKYIFMPFFNGLKSLFGIHSPSTVMEEQGNFIIQGLLNGMTSLVNKVKDIWKDIKEKMKNGAKEAYEGITQTFSNISNWFKDTFSKAWQNVKNVFQNGGSIFNGIKDGILNALKRIINGIISGINNVIAIPFNGLNSALRTIKNISIAGISPFSWLWELYVPQIPQLETGGVLYDESVVKVAEYSGSKTNPEIITPEKILYDTTIKALKDSNESEKAIELTIPINIGGELVYKKFITYVNGQIRINGKSPFVET